MPDTLANDSMSLFYSRMLGAIGATNSASHAPCISSKTFKTNRFVAVQDTEMVPNQASHSGLNTYASPLVVHLEGMTAQLNPNENIRACFIVTHHDTVMELTNAGVTVSI